MQRLREPARDDTGDRVFATVIKVVAVANDLDFARAACAPLEFFSRITVTIFLVAAQVGYLFTPSATGSPYVAVSGAYQTFSPGGGATSSNGPGFGGEVGYRFKLKSSLALRIDGRYRRWFSDFKDINEIGFGLGLGAIF